MAHSYTVTVEVDADPDLTGIFVLDSSALDGTDVLVGGERWSALPAGDVFTVSVRRGRSSDDREYDAGTCVVTVDNRSGAYDPDNVNSPWVILGDPALRIGTQVRVKVTPAAGGSTYTLFTGQVADIDLDDDNTVPTATFSCEDLLAALGRVPVPVLPDGSGAGETGAARAGWLLDLAGVPADRRDLTAARVLAGWSGGGTVRAELERIARGEGGRCYVTRAGVLTISDHAAEYGKTVAVVFTDQP